MNASDALQYAIAVARKFSRCDDPEIESAAGLATAVALKKFDPTRGVTFKTYLGQAVRNAVREFFRVEKTRFCSRFGPAPSKMVDRASQPEIPIPDDLLTRYSSVESDPCKERDRLTGLYHRVLAETAA